MKTSVHPNNIEQNNANKHITKKESISLFSGTAQTGACSQNQIYLYTGALTGFTQYTNKIVKKQYPNMLQNKVYLFNYLVQFII